jgi:acyl-coenzyme A synthetase/AMP-(fatty) acid ligase
MRGYWNAPEQTARTFRTSLGFQEKLLFTGDYFKMDSDGYLYFHGRKDDMIKSRGERISAKEIENTINQIEGVNECAVIGVEDEILGQAIKAFVVPNKKSILNKKNITTYCAKNLETYSVPKYIEVLNELPKTVNGKIEKKTLKDNYNIF